MHVSKGRVASSRLRTHPLRLWTSSATSAASSPQTPLSVPGYPRPALLLVGSLSMFGMTMASGWTPKLQSIRRPFWHPYCMGASHVSCIANTLWSWINFTCAVCGESPMSSGRIRYQTLKFYRSVAYLALKPSCYLPNRVGLDTSSVWVRTGCQNRYSMVNSSMAHTHMVGSRRGTRTCWSPFWKLAV